MRTKETDAKADKFLAIASDFKLGRLVTEASNPETDHLSQDANSDLSKAIASLKRVDDHAICVLSEKTSEILRLKQAINETLQAGRNIYFCGCGATGRLSLAIETLWRQAHGKTPMGNRVFSFMAGGDVALVRSIENFEDFTGYGAKQLYQAGFQDGDLLVATTEGGETPFVIGAAEAAAVRSKRKPFFMYCNPDDILSEVAERSKRVIQNPNIEKVNLTVGPMSITGSTRMQASTILLAVGGIAMLYHDKNDATITDLVNQFKMYWLGLDAGIMQSFTEKEASIYKAGGYLVYETDPHLGITIITDTTERSPTFSLDPFENLPTDPLSLCYLCFPQANTSQEAWQMLLWREPRTLEWPKINGVASHKRLIAFDFSKHTIARRTARGAKQSMFSVMMTEDGGVTLSLEGHTIRIPVMNGHPILVHLALKMFLNSHSTLVMGLLGRYQGNIMTYVRASNNKLIDRAIRYIDKLLKDQGITMPYNDICYELFGMLAVNPPDKPIVLATANEILREKGKK